MDHGKSVGTTQAREPHDALPPAPLPPPILPKAAGGHMYSTCELVLATHCLHCCFTSMLRLFVFCVRIRKSHRLMLYAFVKPLDPVPGFNRFLSSNVGASGPLAV